MTKDKVNEIIYNIDKALDSMRESTLALNKSISSIDNSVKKIIEIDKKITKLEERCN